ncbi:hypothetical protein BDV18DRAFT_91204 [Aspergillus unguis]
MMNPVAIQILAAIAATYFIVPTGMTSQFLNHRTMASVSSFFSIPWRSLPIIPSPAFQKHWTSAKDRVVRVLPTTKRTRKFKVDAQSLRNTKLAITDSAKRVWKFLRETCQPCNVRMLESIKQVEQNLDQLKQCSDDLCKNLKSMQDKLNKMEEALERLSARTDQATGFRILKSLCPSVFAPLCTNPDIPQKMTHVSQ